MQPQKIRHCCPDRPKVFPVLPLSLAAVMLATPSSGQAQDEAVRMLIVVDKSGLIQSVFFFRYTDVQLRLHARVIAAVTSLRQNSTRKPVMGLWRCSPLGEGTNPIASPNEPQVTV